MDESFINQFEDVVARARSHESVEEHPYVLVKHDNRVEDLEKFLPNPLRTKRAIKLIALLSFISYVNRFKVDGTEIHIRTGGGAIALIDAPTPEEPHWAEHSAEFIVTYSDRWKTWDGKNKQNMTQRQFAEFVEDNTVDFVSPSGGDMLDIAKTLHAEQSSNFKSGIRLENGDVSLAYEKTTIGKAGQRGDLEIPSVFQIQVPILEGEPSRLVDIRLRYELVEGKLTFNIEIIRRTALLEEVRRSIFATIANEVKIQPYLVP